MFVFRLHVQPGGGTASMADTLAYCLRHGVLGVGWRTNTKTSTTEWDTYTDEAAAKERALRGGFENPEADNRRWEQLKYRGVHLVEAFVIRKRDHKIVGQSEAFRVMIE